MQFMTIIKNKAAYKLQIRQEKGRQTGLHKWTARRLAPKARYCLLEMLKL